MPILPPPNRKSPSDPRQRCKARRTNQGTGEGSTEQGQSRRESQTDPGEEEIDPCEVGMEAEEQVDGPTAPAAIPAKNSVVQTLHAAE
jgi:hypothetical protein